MNKKVLFTFWDGGNGHLGRILPAAKMLSNISYEVGFISSSNFINYIKNFPFIKYLFQIDNRKAHIHPPPYKFPIYSHAFKHAQRLKGLEFDDTTFLMSTIEQELQIIREFKPNYIINDYRDTIKIAAEIAEVPLIGITNANGNTCGHTMGWWIEPPADLILPDCLSSFNWVRRKYQICEIEDERQSFEGDISVIPNCKTIEPLKTDSDANIYVGLLNKLEGKLTVISDINLKAISKYKKVFCYMGETNNRPKWHFDSLIYDLCQSISDITFIIAGDISRYPKCYELASKSNMIYIKPFYDGGEYVWIMENVDAVITHGGHTGDLALSYGIPVIFIPWTSEPSRAIFSSRFGAGIYLNHVDAPLERMPAPDLGEGVEIMGYWHSEISVKKLQNALEKVLYESSFKLKARSIAKELGQYEGSKTIVEIIENIL